MNCVFSSALFAVVFLFSSNLSAPAWAYLDPGTGSMILQILLGGVAGAMVVGRLYWAKVKMFFGRGSVSENAPHETDT